MKVSQLSGVGKRDHNEDNKLVLESQHIYMVCDGVGGAAKGEIASHLCCETFKNHFSHNNIQVDATTIQQAVAETEKTFDEYLNHHDEARGMASTVTFLAIRDNDAIIAHAGDSRVYHIRDGKIIFKTTDHSFVNDMLASGYITPEEAINHPKKNHITRAIQGSEAPTTVDIHIVTNLQSGDFFLLCSDGILESVSDEFIQKNFIIEKKPEQIISQISDLCASNSSDNYTCVIAQCEKTEIETPKPTPVIVHQSRSPKEIIKVQDSGVRNKKYNAATFWILGILIVAAVSVYFVKFRPGKKNDSTPVEVKTTDPAQSKTTVPPVDDKPATNKDQPSEKNDTKKPISQPGSSASKSTNTTVSNQATDKTIDKEKANSQEATSPKTTIVDHEIANSSTPASTDKSRQNNSEVTNPNDPATKPDVNNSIKNPIATKRLTNAELDSLKQLINQKQPSCDEMRKWNEKIQHVPKYQSQTKAITRFKELFKKCG